MIRKHLNRALLISAGLLLVVGAAAQAPQGAANAHGNAAPQAQGAGGGHGNGNGNGNGGGAGTGAGNGNGAANANNPHADTNAAGTPGAAHADQPGAQGNASERGARMKAEHESERAKLVAALHAPLDDAGKQELKKHAMRVAYLTRIKALAMTAKDQDATDRATKLLDKENARHDKWITSLTATAQTTPPATPNANGGAR